MTRRHPQPATHNTQLATYLLLAVITALAIGLRVLRLSEWSVPFDEGVHLYVAEALYNGQTIYKEVVDNRPYGVSWLVAGVFHLFGPSIVYARLLSVLVAGLTCLVTYATGQEIWEQRTGLLAALFLALDPLHVFWSRFVMTEQFVALFNTAGLYFFLRGYKTHKAWPFIATGFLSGCAFMAKQPAIIVLAPYALFLAIAPWLDTVDPPHMKDLAAWAMALAGGFAMLHVPILGYLHVSEALHDALRFVFWVNQLYPLTDFSEKLAATGHYFLRRPVMVMATLSLAPTITVRRGRQPLGLLLALWWSAELLFLIFLPENLEYRFHGYSHYALSLATPSALLGASWLAWAARQATKRAQTEKPITPRRFPPTSTVTILLAVLLGITAIPFAADLATAAWVSTYPNSPPDQEKAIAQYVRDLTTSQDNILIFSNPIFYHWANRTPATRFLFYNQIFERSPFRNQIVAEIATAAIDEKTTLLALSREYWRSSLPPPMIAWFEREFDLVSNMEYDYRGGIEIYKKRPGWRPASPVPTFTYGQMPIPHLTSASLADQVLLVGYELDREEVYPGGQVHLALFWQVLRKMDKDYTIFVHLRDQTERNVAQQDHQLLGGMFPTSAWREGERIREGSVLTIPPDTPPGQYTLKVGMYLRETLQRLPVVNDTSGENAVVLGTITVAD